MIHRLSFILKETLLRYKYRVQTPFPATPELVLVDDTQFWAVAAPQEETVVIKISTCVVPTIADIWKKAVVISSRLPEHNQIKLLADEDHAIDISVQWLLQHELNHFQIGHFKINGGACLTETSNAPAFALSSRDGIEPSLIDTLSDDEQAKAPLCMELQTDHDSSEIVLGAYHKDNWMLFRYYADCILIVMMLVEREERLVKIDHRTHPYAATRIFMLIAHLFEMPSLPAIKKAHNERLDEVPVGYFPSNEEQVGYNNEVIAAVFADAQIIAEAVGMPKIWDDLGGIRDFFEDIQTVFENINHTPDMFQTVGAKEWAELKPTNKKILGLLGF